MIFRRIFIPILSYLLYLRKRIILKIRCFFGKKIKHPKPEKKPQFHIMKNVQNFKALKLFLDNPIPNCYLKDVGFVKTMWKHETNLNRILKVSNDKKRKILKKHRPAGLCSYSLFKPERYCVIAYIDSKCEIINLSIRGHEEMHAIQIFHCDEAYEKLKARFWKLGFFVRFDLFTMEEQADLVGLLVTIETFGNQAFGKLFSSRFHAIQNLLQMEKYGCIEKIWDKLFPDQYVPCDYYHRMN